MVAVVGGRGGSLSPAGGRTTERKGGAIVMTMAEWKGGGESPALITQASSSIRQRIG